MKKDKKIFISSNNRLCVYKCETENQKEIFYSIRKDGFYNLRLSVKEYNELIQQGK